jgi:autotransporter-associated beta strand protein
MKVNRSNPFLNNLRKSRVARFTAATVIGTFSASAADVFWDIDGDVPGAGGAAPAGNWEDASWSTSAPGDVATDNWIDGLDVAVFSAGTDATDPFTVTTAGPHIIGGLRVEEGSPTISGTGSLELTAAASLFRIDSALTIEVPLTGLDTGILKTGNGTLTLTGANTFDRSMRIEGGKVVIGGELDFVFTTEGTGGLSFGWNGGAGSSVQNLDIVDGADITVDRVALADWYFTENIVSHSGGTLNITGTNDNGTAASFLMGHWGYGSTCVYGLSGGTLNSLGARLSLGWDRANVQFNHSGGTANLAGINLGNGRNNSAAYNLTGGRLNLGSGGINNASAKAMNLGEATLGAFGNWTSTKPLTLTGGNLTIDTLDSADGTTERVISLAEGLTETAPAGLIKTGAGTLSLSGAISYTGDTLVNGGTLLPGASLTTSKIIVNAGGSVGGGTSVTPGTSLIGDLDLNGGNLAFRVGTLSDQLDALTVNVVTPSTVGVIPSQALTVGQEIPVLKYSTLSGLGFGGLTAVLPNPHYTASLIDDSANNQVVVKIDAADELIWTGANSGVWDVDSTENWKLVSGLPGTVASKFYDADVITFDDSSSVGAVTLSGVIKPADITVSNNVTNYSFSGAPIGGGASLTKLGTASLDLSGSNTFSGFTDLQAGRVITSTGTSLGTGGTPVTLGPDVIVQATASYSFARGFQLTGGIAELEVDPGVTTTLTSPWSGGGSLIKTGEGDLRVQGYSGTTGFANTGIIVEEGRLIMATGAFNQNIGLPAITIEQDAELVIPSGTFHALGGAFTTSPVINLNGGIFAIGQEQYLDKINMTGGTIVADGANPQIRADYAFELRTFASSEPSVINGVNFQRVNSDFLFNVEDGTAAEDLVFNGSFETAANPITKTGDGLMVIQGAQGYTAPTNVNGGTLLVQGSLDDTLVTVADTATLTGGGSIVGPVTVQAGGTIAPGTAVGTIQTGSATVAGTYACEIDGTAFDSLVVTGDLDLTGATLDLSVLGGGATEETYVIASFTGALTGNFATVNGLPSGYTVQYKGATKQVVLTTAPLGPYESWEQLNGIAGSGASFDSDGDGIPNGIEFVIGGDPSGPDSDSNSLLPTVAIDATYLTITYRRTDESAGFGPFVEYGSTLGSWTEAEAGVDGVVVNETNDGFGVGIDSVEVKIPRALAVGTKLFARLRIDIP